MNRYSISISYMGRLLPYRRSYMRGIANIGDWYTISIFKRSDLLYLIRWQYKQRKEVSWNSILTKGRQCSQCLLMRNCILYYASPKLFAVAKDAVMQCEWWTCTVIISFKPQIKKNSSMLLKHKSIILCYNMMNATQVFIYLDDVLEIFLWHQLPLLRFTNLFISFSLYPTHMSCGSLMISLRYLQVSSGCFSF